KEIVAATADQNGFTGEVNASGQCVD
ncbi:MAG: hypothetical protein ACI9VM_000081, partial [Candidatus Azotimanducaceae bacterium]